MKFRQQVLSILVYFIPRNNFTIGIDCGCFLALQRSQSSVTVAGAVTLSIKANPAIPSGYFFAAFFPIFKASFVVIGSLTRMSLN